MKGSILVILVLANTIAVHQVAAFTCYKCTSNEGDLCVEKPEELHTNTAIVECEGYCTLVRTEYTDIPGEVVTLVRDCSKEEPLVMNDVRTDKHYTKMYTSCDTSLCNSGDGKREPGSGSGGSLGPNDIIIVYETNNSPLNTPLPAALIGLVMTCFVLW